MSGCTLGEAMHAEIVMLRQQRDDLLSVCKALTHVVCTQRWVDEQNHGVGGSTADVYEALRMAESAIAAEGAK